MPNAYRYRAWDGTQPVAPLAPEKLLSSLVDALLSGDIDQALDRAMHRGVDGEQGYGLTGLDQLRDQVRSERRSAEQALANDEALRRLLEQLRAGQAGGDSALDDESSQLLEAMATRPDAAQRVMSHLGADDRQTLDAGLEARRGGSLDTSGAEQEIALSMPGTLDHLLRQMDGLDTLEARIRRVRRVADVGEIDAGLIELVLGEDASERYQRLAASLNDLGSSGYLRGAGRKLELSARALQHIGDELLGATLGRIASRQPGDRLLARAGSHDLTGSTRDYQFGDPLALDLSRTVLQAVRRGAGVPVKLDPRDFAIFEREDSVRAATVLAIDLSRSMGERGYLLAAKKLALALSTLIRTRFPRDLLLLAGFSESARPLQLHELPRLSWDRFGFGTNIQDGLRLARGQLAAHRGLQRTVILLTDGEPTAHRDVQGAVHFHHPPIAETLAETYAEAERLRRDGITLVVCVLSGERKVVRFAEELARRTAGELIVTDPEDLAAATIVRYGRR